MKKFFLTVAAFLAIGYTQAQTRLVEEVSKKGDELVIPYKKYVLDNGLTLIVHEDNSDPLVHVDVTYHVGSAREELHKSGFAHFFEHMMFQGSANVADEEHFKIVTESGGTLNGTTNRDRTNYFETVPSNQLERMLWLEADRMGFLLDAVTNEKFEVQRATVKNEKGQNYDNRPYGLWRELTAETLYPYGHPYSWLTIGKLEDLDRADLADLKNFFMRWYGPNNAVLTVGGDVNPEEVVSLVEKYFGSIPAGPAVEPMKLDAPKLDQDRYVSYVDNNIRFPALMVTFPTVPNMHPDEAALSCLAEILGSGKESYFYKKFTLTQKAVQASVFSSNDELAGEMTMFVLPYPGTKLSDFEADLRATLKEFEANGVTDVDVQKFKAGYEAGLIRRLESVSGKVSRLAAYETFAANPNYIKEEMARYNALTKEDVIRVYNKYIKDQNAVVVSVLPKGMEGMGAAPDNFTAQTEGENPFPTTDYSGLSFTAPKDDFDRTKKPAPGANPQIKVPELWEASFKNGIKMIGTESNELPTVVIQMEIEGGQQLEAFDLGKAGIASLTASMMNEGTQKYTAEQLSEELKKLGSSISVYSGSDATYLRVSSLTKNLDATLELAEEILMNPAFPEDAFERLKKQQIESIKQSEKDPSSIASRVYDVLLYGQDHVKAMPSEGTEESVAKLTIEDVKNFYTKYYSPSVTKIVVVGDVQQKEITNKLAFLKNWEAKEVKLPKLAVDNKIEKTKLYLVDKPNAPQSQIRIGYLTGMPYDATGEYYKVGLMNYTLGGAFNSRINLNLREDKGFTYGARSYFNSGKEDGLFTASAGVRGDATAASVREFMKEITEFNQNGITADELEFLKSSIGQRDARSYETPYQKARFLSEIITYDLDKGFINKQAEILKKMDQNTINALAKKYLPYQKMHIVVVGDKASNYEALKELGYEIVELDAKGNPVTLEAGVGAE
jgi:zinc protease